MRRILGFLICFIGVLLPWRLRVIFSEALGWIAQFFTLLYFGAVKLIVDSLAKTDAKGKT